MGWKAGGQLEQKLAAAVNAQNVYTKMTARVLQGMKPDASVKQAAQEAIQIFQQ